jgi:hypothetical protein
MWDWEINRYLRSQGIRVIAPYNLEQTLQICRMISLKRELKKTKFLVYQDNPGEGFQASIFKRFYWWEDECIERMEKKFGVKIVKRSFKELGERAKQIPDVEADQVWDAWEERIKTERLTVQNLRSAIKIYLAVRRDLDADSSIRAAGMNCLNESHFSDTTPCLAWNMFFEGRRLIWGCEADIVSMLTEHLVYEGLGAPMMMTNLYPFLMGQAALKHEHIPEFPSVPEEPENHILAAHCGYLGVVPKSFAEEWTLKKKVLAIVNPNAHAIDARMPTVDITLIKIDATFNTISAVEGELVGYAGFPGSDCLNGAVIKVPDGRALLANLASHHYILAAGHQLEGLEMLAEIFGMKVELPGE